MDLAIGAKKTYVMMEFLTKSGESKLVPQCAYPLTGIGCVSRIYTDIAVIDLGPTGAVVIDMVEGLTLAQLQELTSVPLAMANSMTNKVN